MREIRITQADNGYVIRNIFTDIDGKKETTIIVAEDVEDTEYSLHKFGTSDEEKIALGKMLRIVGEELGEVYNKFKKDNLRIDFKKEGHKVIDNDSEIVKNASF